MRITINVVVFLSLAAVASAQCPPATPANWCSGGYQYDGMGNVTAIGGDNYVYDELGRLKNGTADVQRTGRLSRQNYEYDLFGNRLNTYRDSGSVECLGGCELSPPLAVSPTTNHITNHSPLYDDAGNLTRIDTATYSYDAAGSLTRAVATDDRQYLYTADDERIGTKNGLTWTWTVRGLDQKVLREFTSGEVGGLPTGNRQWARDYVWRDGRLLASVAPGNVIQHYHLDHLGTPRVVSNATGVRIGEHAYYPFGAELTLTPHELPEELMKFTGHERDVQGNDAHTLDMMHARYEMATLGRFMSVDPNLDIQQAILRPQEWNRYAYVRNIPIVAVDPDGKATVVFIVDAGADDVKEMVGHAAIYVTSNGQGAGVSAYGDDWFQRGEMGFIKHYNAEGRGVHTYVLDTTPEQDAAMLKFIKDHPSASSGKYNERYNGNIDESKSIVRQNCTTACVNVLKAGGVVKKGDPGAMLGMIDRPKTLQKSLENGSLSWLVRARRFFRPAGPCNAEKASECR
jgi:RHS repeat-associated protein